VNIPDGARAQSRMSAIATAVLVEQQIGIESVLHYCCRDRNLLGMMSDLLGAAALGLRNILVITGDPPKMGPYPDATAVFDIDSIGLTNMVNKLNHGLDLGNNPIGEPTAFCIGVGVNPGAINLDEEIKRFEWKVEAGAQYAITQPVFDTGPLRDFLKRIEHVRIPIIAGIWPLVSYRNRGVSAQRGAGRARDAVYHGPHALRRQHQQEAGRDEGLKIARESLLEVRDEIQGVQVSAPFGNVKYALEVFEALPKFSRDPCLYPRLSVAKICLNARSSVGHLNDNLFLQNTGFTLWLDNNSASPSHQTPVAPRMPASGNSVGFDSTRPSVFVNSAFVTGFGATKFTGPLTDPFNQELQTINNILNRIQLIHCFPFPMRPPIPIRKASASSPARLLRVEDDAEARVHGPDSLLDRRLRRVLPSTQTFAKKSSPGALSQSTTHHHDCRSNRSPTRSRTLTAGVIVARALRSTMPFL
jgi:5,10-methylenetetrahydrofolate reductase